MRILPKEIRLRLLPRFSSEQAEFLNELLSYSPETAGALMSKEFISVPVDFTIKQANEHIHSMSMNRRKYKVTYLYGVDSDMRLEGVIQLRDFLFYPPETPLRNILKTPVVQVETGMTQMDVARLLERHHYLGLPVVDKAQRMAGLISADKVLKVFEEEANDDIAKFVGTDADEIRTSSVRRILRLRLPWLCFNLISGLFCAYIAGLFQDVQSLALLFLFVPVVLGLSESSGVQSATLIVRNISLGKKRFENLKPFIKREIAVGLLTGAICGTIVGVFTLFWNAKYMLGFAVWGSLCLAICFSTIIGLCLPMFFQKMKIDPALASGPLVLALCDLQTLLIYFNLSGALLS
ncbi:MAG: magnesium transporter [uncultured bacterium]|nr:MAG: magnesium transporter [uncultured bacterium]